MKGVGDKMEQKTINYYTRFSIQKLWNYTGGIFDIGLEPDQEGNPAFYILTTEEEHISVSVIRPQEIGRVCQWLDRLNTGVNVEFKNFDHFNKIIQKVFNRYNHTSTKPKQRK